MINELPHTSASQIKTFVRCPAAYRFRYLLRLRAPYQSEALTIGIGIGNAIRATVPPGSPNRRAIWLNSWRDYVRRAWEWIDPEADKDAMIDKGVTMIEALADSSLGAYLGEPEYKIEGVELFDPDTGEELPPLLGYLDFYDPLLNRVTEFKTGRGILKWDQHLIQLALYRHGATRINDDGTADPPKMRLIQVSKAKAPRVMIEDCVITDNQQRWVMAIVAQTVASIKSDHLPPRPSYACANCDFRRACQDRDFSGLEEKPQTKRELVGELPG